MSVGSSGIFGGLFIRCIRGSDQRISEQATGEKA
jgi:hypothetical protein